MKPTAIYFFLFLMLAGMPLLRAQDSGKTPPLPEKTVWSVSKEQEDMAQAENCFFPQDSHSTSHSEWMSGFPKNLRILHKDRQGLRTGGNAQSFGERMGVIRSGADSVMKEVGNYTPLTPLGKPFDSALGKRSGPGAGGNDPGFDKANKLRAKEDSLQNRLDSLKNKATGRLAEAEEEAGKVTRKIDSLENLLNRRLGKVKVSALKGNAESLLGDPATSAGILERSSRIYSGTSLFEQEIPKGDLTNRIDQRIRNEILNRVQDDGLLGIDLPKYQLPGEVNEYGQILKDPSQIDQIADARAAQMAELKELGAQTKELEALKGLPEEMLADLKRYQDEQAIKEELKNKVVQKATDFLAGHMDKLTQAQGAMIALKKKYSYVPDSRDLSTAVKNTSLKNEPLKRRFRYGLGFQVHHTDPVSLDLSPNVQYRFNKMFSAGISGTYRANLQIENNGAVAKNTVQDVYGAGAFAQYRLSFIKPGSKWLGGFFAHAEFEYMSTRPQDLKTRTQAPAEAPTRTWHPGLPIGIGKQMRLSKALRGVIIFTYDVLHNEYSPNPKAWNIKFGFQLGRFRLKDIHI